MKIGFVPIDNRPVCYTLPKQIAQIDESIEFFLPQRQWLGDLTKYADVDKILTWLENLPQLDAIIISLDTVAYGGLVASRRTPLSYEQIKDRLDKFKENRKDFLIPVLILLLRKLKSDHQHHR